MNSIEDKKVKHPAKFTDSILAEIQRQIEPLWFPEACVLDPFAGVGKLANVIPHENLWLNEIELEWLEQCPDDCVKVLGDALRLRFSDGFFDFAITSCCYGNRMSDHHNAKDGSRRNTYKHMLGRDLHPNNSGQFQWDGNYEGKYCNFHIKSWNELWRVLKPNGYFFLNVSDHIRKGKIQNVSDFHLGTCIYMGFDWIKTVEIETPRNRFGANRELRVDHENLYIFKKGTRHDSC